MIAFLTIIHVLVSVVLMGSILLQSSKGGGLAGMLGGGGSGMMGGRGAATLLSKVTMWAGIAFALTSITIGLLTAGTSGEQRSIVEQMVNQEAQTSTPATMLPTIPTVSPGAGTSSEAEK